jgi:uncharacterized damage-inducible protein DinB
MKDYFRRLYEYNNWANEAILEKFKLNSQQIPEKTLNLMSHTITAQRIWYSRIANKEVEVGGLFETYSLPYLEQISKVSTTEWLSLINASINYNEKISYTNTKGDKFENITSDIMAHVVNHASYHRGQVNMILRESGIEPANTDFIAYARKY